MSKNNQPSAQPAAIASTHAPVEGALPANEAQSQAIEARQALGSLLRQARERRGLSIESLAEQSLVHTRFIRALEQAGNPQIAPTYVRGYLKILAELLTLDAELLLSLHARAEQQQPAPTERVAPTPVPRQRSVLQVLGQHIQLIINEALGAVALAFASFGQLFGNVTSRQVTSHKATSPKVTSRSGATRSSRQAAKPAPAAVTTAENDESAQRPRALMHSGSAWSSSSLLNASSGMRFGAVAASLLCFVFFAGIFLGQQADAPAVAGASSVEVNGSESEPLGELASTALAAGSESQLTDNRTTDNRTLVPLNREERQAALAGLDADTASAAGVAVVDGVVDVGAEAESVAAEGGSRLAAIESSSAATDLPGGAAGSTTGSIINVGELGADGQINAGARRTAGRSALNDSYEPIGPGAEYMIAQHAVQDRLVISVYEDSWVDVRDANGVRLYRDLAVAGRRIDLSGELPFALHVGNAPGLALELNGEYVPIERYRSDNSARLTLAGDHSATRR